MGTVQSNFIECDLLVIGAGMAGLSAGARAAETGARVGVLEKGPRPGGSAALSNGGLWTVPTFRLLHCIDDGDPELGRVLVEGYGEAVAWLRARGVSMSPPIPVDCGRGYQIDIKGHLKHCVSTIESHGGFLAVNVSVNALIKREDGKVEGARATDGANVIQIHAASTLLATGGFQASPDLRAERIHPNAWRIPLRSNPYSDGGGIRLGLAAGGVWAGENRGFYGHLVCSPARLLDNPDQIPHLTQYNSDHALLLNEAGMRFTDESLGDNRSAQAVVAQSGSRALLVWDEYVQAEVILKPSSMIRPPEDKWQIALDHGALVTRVVTLDELAEPVVAWGFDGSNAVRTIHDYNAKTLKCPELLDPPKEKHLRPISQPPFYAMVVEPGITFTHDGLRVDKYARALSGEGKIIPGLLVAGADVGNIYRGGYAGGLAPAIIFGLRAVETAGWMSGRPSHNVV